MRTLAFTGIPNSYDIGEIHLAVTPIIAPFEFTVEGAADGSTAMIVLPDEVSTSLDTQIALVVAQHAKDHLAMFRQLEIENDRTASRLSEILTTLKHQHAGWRRSKNYLNDGRDRVIDLIVDFLMKGA